MLACFVLASLCWLVLLDGLWSTCLRPALNTSSGVCFNASEYICDVVVFGDDVWVESFVKL